MPLQRRAEKCDRDANLCNDDYIADGDKSRARVPGEQMQGSGWCLMVGLRTFHIKVNFVRTAVNLKA